MDDTYAYIKVKIYFKEGQTEQTIDDIVSTCDYNFNHEEIIDHEIMEVYDVQIPDNNEYQLPLEFDCDKDTDDYYGGII